MADWDRIVRHGIKRDGAPAVMPSEDFFKMSDRELSDVVAYITSLPAVDAEVPAPSFGPIGKVLLATGKFPVSAEKVLDHQAAHPLSPPEASDSAVFGEHLTAICTGCHQGNLAGGPMPFGPPDWPAAGNLTQHDTGLKGWSFQDFEKAITEGVSKDGRKLREPMTAVLPAARAMTPTERRAIWTYLSSLPPHAPND
jgi:mono/diheme cytochrome c family protein